MGRFFMPEEVERVHAFVHWTELAPNVRIDGPALITWKYAGEVPRYGSWEVIASLAMRVRSDYYVSDDRIEIHGSEGIIWVNRCTGKLLDEPAVVLYRDGETRAFHDLACDWAESFRLGGIDFVDALLEGRPAPPDRPKRDGPWPSPSRRGRAPPKDAKWRSPSWKPDPGVSGHLALLACAAALALPCVAAADETGDCLLEPSVYHYLERAQDRILDAGSSPRTASPTARSWSGWP